MPRAERRSWETSFRFWVFASRTRTAKRDVCRDKPRREAREEAHAPAGPRHEARASSISSRPSLRVRLSVMNMSLPRTPALHGPTDPTAKDVHTQVRGSGHVRKESKRHQISSSELFPTRRARSFEGVGRRRRRRRGLAVQIDRTPRLPLALTGARAEAQRRAALPRVPRLRWAGCQRAPALFAPSLERRAVRLGLRQRVGHVLPARLQRERPREVHRVCSGVAADGAIGGGERALKVRRCRALSVRETRRYAVASLTLTPTAGRRDSAWAKRVPPRAGQPRPR
jgi:hypothetical protein